MNTEIEEKTLENNVTEHKNTEPEQENTDVPVISLKNVDIFQQKILVLSDITFTINKGEFVYVVGRTGSGKSNLLKLLYGDIEAVTGEIEVAGYNMRKIKTKNIQRLRRKLGIVFQDYQLLQDRSVYDNLKFVTKVTGWKNKQSRHERITEVLGMVDLKTKGHKMPHQLSGGEQQRVCIARALINNPDIILADEPTGNLDPETSFDVFYILKQIAEKGTAVLIATHDFLIINQIPSRVLQIQDGKVFE
ncbi:MAG: ATP-binding cassette domain-containing protein [Bacteroidales bacterium]|jgi:cell division transport system ATP-binding protein|nr:ATP-binding cassette domain-containing protein [Bacteroidales bacterium]